MILLEEIDTKFGNIKITRSKRDGSVLYHQDECFHSLSNAQGVSACMYINVMHRIISQSIAQDVLMIGCAGGTLATMLHRLGRNVTVVDINPIAFTLAKKYFQMPKEVQCVSGDGFAYLVETTNRYDAIVIDAFMGDGSIPEQFTTENFFKIVKEVLNPFGIVTMNVLQKDDADIFVDEIALNMESANIPSILFDWSRKPNRNIIIAGGTIAKVQGTSQRKPRL